MKVRPTVRFSTGTRGRSDTSWRWRVDRTRRCPSSSPWSSSSGPWSWSSSSVSSRSRSPGSSGSSSRCQPSAHWVIRSQRAFFAHDGQRDSRVDPHGIATVVVAPVARSVTRRSTGRTHTDSLTARARTISVVMLNGTDLFTPHRQDRQGRAEVQWPIPERRCWVRRGRGAGPPRTRRHLRPLGEPGAVGQDRAVLADRGHDPPLPRSGLFGVGGPGQVAPGWHAPGRHPGECRQAGSVLRCVVVLVVIRPRP